jgi:hypothetical protein
MRWGVIGSHGSPAQLHDTAVAAEDAGWDGFFTWDAISMGAMRTWDPGRCSRRPRRARRIRLEICDLALRGDLAGHDVVVQETPSDDAGRRGGRPRRPGRRAPPGGRLAGGRLALGHLLHRGAVARDRAQGVAAG